MSISITESENVESQFLNESLTSHNEDIDFRIMEDNTKFSTIKDQEKAISKARKKKTAKSLARK